MAADLARLTSAVKRAKQAHNRATAYHEAVQQDAREAYTAMLNARDTLNKAQRELLEAI